LFGLQYGSPYDPYGSCSPRLQTTYTSASSNNGAGGNGSNGSNGTAGLHPEAGAVYVTGDALPPLVSTGSTSLPTSTASYTRYEVVPSSYATTHAIRSSSSSSKVLTVDLPSPDSGIGADAVTPRQDHHQATALHQVSSYSSRLISHYSHTGFIISYPSYPLIISNFLFAALKSNPNDRLCTFVVLLLP
jgi:hypothetical protein